MTLCRWVSKCDKIHFTLAPYNVFYRHTEYFIKVLGNKFRLFENELTTINYMNYF